MVIGVSMFKYVMNKEVQRVEGTIIITCQSVLYFGSFFFTLEVFWGS